VKSDDGGSKGTVAEPAKRIEVAPLERDLERGWILEDGIRIVSFRIGTFQALVQKIVNITGTIVAGTLLYQAGNEIGRTLFEYSKDQIHTFPDIEKVFDTVMTAHGWGRCVKIEQQNQVYTVSVRDCSLCLEQESQEPVCDMLRGIAAGAFEAYLSKKAKEAKEVQCAAVSGELCVFEITFTD
jgi:predicted hydrocarbon binding protein